MRECALVTRAFDQLQMHLVGAGGTYRIHTMRFDAEGNVVAPMGMLGEVDTGSAVPTFGIVRPAVPNTQVDCSPYGQSVFADAVNAIQSADPTFDALINEVDAGKLRVFLPNVVFDQEKDAKGRRVPIPFDKEAARCFARS